ncbi:unnamed protein product [Paramecium sonneborni]|uniref:Uncharacterized protein n=1 Tax=Paramecium sonneborni TaxID=65129 RepID=A0A8S1Q6E3_9CILI|nr:unnamed protein product [Paramecium sonneborni]
MGQWIELSERFQNASQIFNTGEYNNGIKIGKWDVLCKKGIDQFEWMQQEYLNKTSGGGSYNNEKQDGLKIGKWIELSNQFSNWNQITYKGEYKKGQKVGVWVILWNWYGENQQMQIRNFKIQNKQWWWIV